MTPVQKALWHIETRLDAPDLSLAGVARLSGVSRFHLTRAFHVTLGLTPMAYVRARRLSLAAKALAGGAPDILQVALSAAYGSHEAFTRAFREAFGLTPESLRQSGDISRLKLMEPIRMTDPAQKALEPPRIVEDAAPFTVMGINQTYPYNAPPAGIPAQWMRLIPHLGQIPGQKGSVTYGVVHNDRAGTFDYMCAVEVAAGAVSPDGFTRLEIPGGRYALYIHKGHIAGLPATFAAIWNGGLAAAGLSPRRQPVLERYGPEFDAMRGDGQMEIWIPVEVN